MNFSYQENMDAILYRLDDARWVLKQSDNTALLSAMLDLVLATHCPLLVGLGLVQCLHWLDVLWNYRNSRYYVTNTMTLGAVKITLLYIITSVSKRGDAVSSREGQRPCFLESRSWRKWREKYPHHCQTLH